MARITVNVTQHPDPTLIEEDVEMAAEGASIRDYVVTEHDSYCFTVDAYSDRELSSEQVAAFENLLPEGGTYGVFQIADCPPQGWAYAEKEIKY